MTIGTTKQENSNRVNLRMNMDVEISLNNRIETDEVIELYQANNWSSAEKPKELIPARAKFFASNF